MEALMGVMVFLHVLFGVVLAMTLVIMQLVINPALANIPAGIEKQNFAAVVQRRWHPVVDSAIVVLTLTALFFLHGRWAEIVASPILPFKVTTGIITLTCANLLHFYFRGKKRRLKAAGETEKLAKTSALTAKLEKVALIFGATTLVLALSYNHTPF
jgi:uncharacterized membrane protein